MNRLFENTGFGLVFLILISGAILYWLWRDMKRQKEWREKKLRDIAEKKARIARKTSVGKPQ
ncbi:MAG: hypothetical protein V3U82_04175 [Robiginitomaculum sp.]